MKGANGQLPRPRPDLRLYLFHGADEAGASDLARRLIAGMGEAERVDLDGATLRREPGRLADEAASLSLFGDARVIRATGVGEESLEALTLLLAADRAGSPVVALAPSVKASARIVKLALDSPRALGIACYPPTGAELERVVAALLTEAGLRAGPGVAAHIVESAGGDRAVMAREVEKLALFLDAAPERPRDATAADLHAIGAELDDAELNGAVEALIEGRAGELGAALTRLDEGGASAIPWLRAINRKLVSLAEMRTAIDGGDDAAAVMKRHRVHFREEAGTGRALRRWSPRMLADALARLREAERAVVAPLNAGAVLAERAAIGLARQVESR